MDRKDADIEQRIAELLSEMTLEEKVGQLQQCGPSLVGAFDVSFEELVNMVFDGRITKEKFDELLSTAKSDFHEEDLRAGRIGSYNGISDAKIVNRLQKIAVEETRLGIPLLFGYDVIHGYRTITPIPLAESCAWDPKLWEETARISAEEASAGGIHMTFAPMVDVARDARWGRISEGAGEDTCLNARYGAAKVRGFQGKNLEEKDTLAACVKHFAGYGAAESGRDYNRVEMSMQSLYEDYLPPFSACIEAGARAVMPALHDLNGTPCTANKWLLTQVLRREWGFDGMTVSDSNAVAECVEHGVASDRAEAAAQALEAGVDMDMASGCYSENLVRLAEQKKLDVTALDRAVSDVLRIKFEMGLFEHPYRTDEKRETDIIMKAEFRQAARKAAQQSIVLLKNEGVLPLKEGMKLVIAGELADMREEMTGTWANKAVGDDCVSLLDACRTEGINYRYFQTEEVLAVQNLKVKLGRDCDVILAAVGEMKKQSGEAASRAEISLPHSQIEMIKKLLETGKPVAAILFNGRPLGISWLKEHVPAIVEAWHPGIEAGNAILDVLSGRVNPSAKLTVTFPSMSGQCPMYYAHTNTGRPAGKSKYTSKYLDAPMEPVYPFGYGLSYTAYEYTDMEVRSNRSDILISVKVRNTGAADGEEIVQCYFHDPVAQRVRPVKKLVDFARIPLKSGESKEVVFQIPKEKLGYYDEDMNFLVEDGNYEFYVGGNSADCLMQGIRIGK